MNSRIELLLTCLLAGVAVLAAQTSSGVIAGKVLDPSGLPVASAPVTLINELTGDNWKTVSGVTGDFAFASIQPGRFTLAVQAAGFKQLQKTGLVLTASERLAVGSLTLEVGTVTDSVTVTAEATPVQTASHERSAVLNDKQISLLMVRGRDFLNLLKVMPGVVAEGGGADILSGSTSPTVQGIRSEYNTVNLDGVTSNMGGAQWNNVPLNLDAISEVKVLLGNYQAEYGRNSGAVINAVTRTGTQSFHGSAYYYKRHEMFNANQFFRNFNGFPKPRYRYTTFGYNLGGPIYWPGKFNSNKTKLFFFFSQEILPTKQPGGLRTYTVPTDLERKGDFSKTLDLAGTVIPIKDPTNGAPFPNNVIPANRINPNMQKLLGVFPMPNFLDRSISKGNYNYAISDTLDLPTRQEVGRVDYNITSKLRAYGRFSTFSQDYRGVTFVANYMPWLNVPGHYKLTSPQITGNLTYAASPTLVNEFSFGRSRNTEDQGYLNQSDYAKVQRDKLGIQLSQLNPKNNPLNLIPAASFGGVPSAATFGFDPRFPMKNYSTGWNFTDGLSKVWRNHNFKAGVFIEKFINFQPHHAGISATMSGSLAFGRDTNNPLDSNYAYSNALLGNFASYAEPNNLVDYAPQVLVWEWYAQDNWRITKKLTLEIGARFTLAPPFTFLNNQGATLALERWDPKKAPALYLPARNAQGVRVARNPLTGELLPAVYIGRIVPNSGDPVNGAVVAGDKTYPAGFMNPPTMAAGPRIGFAYDVFGDGKTAIRGGFGIFNNARPRGGQAGDLSFNPPVQYTPVQYYGNVETFLNATGSLAPTTWQRVMEKTPHLVSSYNLNFGIQRNIGFSTVVDAAYSSTLGRHLGQTRQLNTVPYGARFLPENQDPTTGGPLPDNFFRPYPGFANVPYMEFASSSNYHSLQVQANRRFTKGLQFGLAWTWSKAMDFTDDYAGGVAVYAPRRVWNYGRAGFDRTHVFVANWLADIPKLTKVWNNPVVGAVLDNWQFSGIMTMSSGAPMGIGLSTVDGQDITGGGDGSRINVTGKVQLPKGERTFSRWINTSVFTRPAKGDRGNAPKDVFRGPGINNFDLSLFKNIPIRDRAAFQLRWETYNAFNHTQFSGLDTGARFNLQGAQVNTRFGQLTSARDPRIMQVSLRLNF